MNYARERKLGAFKRNTERKPSVTAQYEAMQKALEEFKPADQESPLGRAVKDFPRIVAEASRHQGEPGSL